MKTPVSIIIAVVTSGLTASSMGALFVTAADISGATPQSSYSGVVGVRFGVEAGDIPAGQTVRITQLGFFAGISGQFAGAGTVDFSHEISLSGPLPFTSRSGNYSSLQLGTVTVTVDNAVDSNGWSWVALSSPVDLVGGQYYTLVTTVTNGQTADPYFDPFAGPSGSASLIAPGSIFRNGTSGDTYMKGRYALGNGEEAFDQSGYLGANMQYELIPEPASAMTFVFLTGLGLARRRR